MIPGGFQIPSADSPVDLMRISFNVMKNMQIEDDKN